MPLALYEYPQAFLDLMARVDETGEIDDQLAAELDALEGDFAAKAERTWLYARELAAESEAVGTEASRLSMRAWVLSKQADRLRDYVFRTMEAAGIDRLRGRLCALAICNNSRPTLHCDNPTSLPEEYQNVYKEVKPDSEALLQAYKQGRPLPEGVSFAVGKHLRGR